MDTPLPLLLANPLADISFNGIGLGSGIAIIVVLFLLIISAYMSSSEVAFFSLKPVDLEEIKQNAHPKDKQLSALLRHSEQLLATILIGNNVVNVAVVMLSTFAIHQMFAFTAPVVAFLMETVLLTFLLLLFGEIMPKVYAQLAPLKFSRFSAPTMTLFFKAVAPLSRFMMRSTGFVTRQIGKKKYGISVGELSKAIDLTTEAESEEKQMISEILKFYDKTAGEIMVPRIDMVDIDYEWDFRQMLDFAVSSGYSRIPVFHETEDNIKGIIYLKDLIEHKSKDAMFDWHSLMRKAYFVPENKKIDALLEEFRANKIHISVVVDEFGGTQGIITMEDILEEIVGEITDEYDEEALPYTKNADGSYIFEARTSLTDVQRYLDLPDDAFGLPGEEVDTLGGLVLEIKQELPHLGDEVSLDSWQFTVISMDKRRITQVKIVRKPQVSPPNE